jgi:hypothetical protein
VLLEADACRQTDALLFHGYGKPVLLSQTGDDLGRRNERVPTAEAGHRLTGEDARRLEPQVLVGQRLGLEVNWGGRQSFQPLTPLGPVPVGKLRQ